MGAQKGNRNATLQEQDSKDRYDSTRSNITVGRPQKKTRVQSKGKSKENQKNRKGPCQMFLLQIFIGSSHVASSRKTKQ